MLFYHKNITLFIIKHLYKARKNKHGKTHMSFHTLCSSRLIAADRPFKFSDITSKLHLSRTYIV